MQSMVSSGRLPVASCRLPVAGCQLPVASYQLPASDIPPSPKATAGKPTFDL
jgi:hypothetical protein